MRDDYHARSQERGIDRDSEAFRTIELEEQQDDYYQSRQDSSRSPPRHDFYDDARDGHTRYQRDMHHDRDYDGRYRDTDNGRSRRDGSSHGSRHHGWDHDSQGGMYDDGYHRGHQEEDDKRVDVYFHRHERKSYGSGSPPGYLRRSLSRSPTREAGRPSDTVILEGLPFNISTSELRESLLSNSIAAEFPSIDVRVSSSKGNCRAFVQFGEIKHAIVFVKEHFPQLLIHLPHFTDELPEGKYNVYVHYARPRDDVDTRVLSGGNWLCTSCDFSNYASRSKCKICGASPSASSSHQSLSGIADATDVPSQILVVHPLPPFVTEDMLASDMKRLELEKPDPSRDASRSAPKLKSTAPTGDASGYGARPGSIHRVFLMRDPKTDQSVKYGFVEFWSLEDAVAAMTKFRMSRSFAVATCAVTVSHIHLGVFIPEEREIVPAIERLSFSPLFNPSLRVKYRDPHAYPSQKLVSMDPPNDAGAKSQNGELNGDGKKSKKRKADVNLGTSAVKKSAPVMAGHMALWQKKHDEIYGSKSSMEGPPSSTMSAANQVPLSSGSTNPLKPDTKAPIKISLSGSTILAASPAPDMSPPLETHSNGGMSSENQDIGQASGTGAGAAVSYVDRERLMCLICMRKYKSADEVNIHEKSRNHKTAMSNEKIVKAALPRLAARDKRMQKEAEEEKASGSSTGLQYRDRAKERREVYHQPKKPLIQADKTNPDTGKPHRKHECKAASAKPTQSKGAEMLAKMGWTSGSGLGAKGEGQTESIATNAYQEGVGLGAEGGNLGDAADLAEKRTRNSYTEYVSTVQDKARERYNKLN